MFQIKSQLSKWIGYLLIIYFIGGWKGCSNTTPQPFVHKKVPFQLLSTATRGKSTVKNQENVYAIQIKLDMKGKQLPKGPLSLQFTKIEGSKGVLQDRNGKIINAAGVISLDKANQAHLVYSVHAGSITGHQLTLIASLLDTQGNAIGASTPTKLMIQPRMTSIATGSSSSSSSISSGGQGIPSPNGSDSGGSTLPSGSEGTPSLSESNSDGSILSSGSEEIITLVINTLGSDIMPDTNTPDILYSTVSVSPIQKVKHPQYKYHIVAFTVTLPDNKTNGEYILRPFANDCNWVLKGVTREEDEDGKIIPSEGVPLVNKECKFRIDFKENLNYDLLTSFSELCCTIVNKDGEIKKEIAMNMSEYFNVCDWFLYDVKKHGGDNIDQLLVEISEDDINAAIKHNAESFFVLHRAIRTNGRFVAKKLILPFQATLNTKMSMQKYGECSTADLVLLRQGGWKNRYFTKYYFE